MKKDLIIHEAPKSPISEAIRTLRTSVTYKMSKNNYKSFLVTSPSTEDGKSLIISNLAIAFSQSKQKVLIIDSDLRKGRQHEIFNVNNVNGLAQALNNKNINVDNEYLDSEIEKYILKTHIENVFIIPSGIVPHNPSELFENPQFDLIIENLKNKYDVILFDAPPINIVTDSMILCNKADGVILVCAIEKTKTEALIETKKKIQNMGGNIIGVVVNKMPMDKMKEYTKDYGRYTDNQIIKYDDKKYKIS